MKEQNLKRNRINVLEDMIAYVENFKNCTGNQNEFSKLAMYSKLFSMEKLYW